MGEGWDGGELEWGWKGVTDIPMIDQTAEHVSISREMLAKAEEALAQDDLLQASEKGWGARPHGEGRSGETRLGA